MNTARHYIAGFGLQTAAFGFGGYTTAVVSSNEEYDGTSWASAPSLATARHRLAGGGTTSSGVGFGGGVPSVSNATEEFTGETTAVRAVKTIDFD
jgi:hypothetical protein